MGIGIPGDEEQAKRDREYAEKLARVRIFPGSRQDYELVRGYEVEVIDTKRENMGMRIVKIIDNNSRENLYAPFDRELRDYLIDNNVEAIVEAQRQVHSINLEERTGMINYYGLPVRRKREK